MEERTHEGLTIEELAKALRSDPENQDIRITLARKLVMKDEAQEAAEWIVGAPQIVGAEARNQAAWICVLGGKNKEALALVDDSVEFLKDPESSVATILLVGVKDALEEGRLEDAEELLIRLQDGSEESQPGVCYYSAILRKLRGQPLEARSYFEQALKLDPDFTDALVGLGNHYFEVGELSEAERNLSRAVELEPYYTDALSGLCRIRLSQEKLPEARQLAAKVLACSPAKPEEGLRLMVEVQRRIHPLLGLWWRWIAWANRSPVTARIVEILVLGFVLLYLLSRLDGLIPFSNVAGKVAFVFVLFGKPSRWLVNWAIRREIRGAGIDPTA